MGEPAGVGGEVTLKAWLRGADKPPPFFVIDDPARLEKLASALGLQAPIEAIDDPAEAEGVFARALPVLPMALEAEVVPGEMNPANAPAVLRAIKRAVELVNEEKASAVVTNPIHKQVLYEAGFTYPGHTEFLAALAGIDTPPVMMLACSELRVVPITVHVALAEAVKSLNARTIIDMALITDAGLRRDFAMARPRLAIAGLNPHAGEGGGMGAEEIEIIRPAIEQLDNMGLDVVGPVPPDTLFTTQARKNYDAAICMYHDQALIPIKTIDFERSVNVTLGLPFVRTSPDHGTALDIAGTGRASENSMLAALHMAAGMAKRREAVTGG